MAYVTTGNRRQGRVLVVNDYRYIRSRTATTGILRISCSPTAMRRPENC